MSSAGEYDGEFKYFSIKKKNILSVRNLLFICQQITVHKFRTFFAFFSKMLSFCLATLRDTYDYVHQPGEKANSLILMETSYLVSTLY